MRKNRVFSQYMYQMASFKPKGDREDLGHKSALAGFAGGEAFLLYWMVKASECDATTYSVPQVAFGGEV